VAITLASYEDLNNNLPLSQQQNKTKIKKKKVALENLSQDPPI